jgi:hypothetical protein
MPYASASGGAVDPSPAPGTGPFRRLSDGETERGDMTGVRATSPLVVIALGSRP